MKSLTMLAGAVLLAVSSVAFPLRAAEPAPPQAAPPQAVPPQAVPPQAVPHLAPGFATPVAHPYATPDQALRAVDQAFAAAHASGKRVLIDFGANWCPDCRMLAGVMDQDAVKPWIARNFEPVSVNVDHFNVNMDVAKRYGVTVKAIPTVLIITPDGKLLNPDATLTLGNARTMSSQAVVDLIADWNTRS